LADYFRARSAAEADYAAALNKLARKFAETGMGNGSSGESGLWERVMSEIQEVSLRFETLNARNSIDRI
jgi:hypothetical protein